MSFIHEQLAAIKARFTSQSLLRLRKVSNLLIIPIILGFPTQLNGNSDFPTLAEKKPAPTLIASDPRYDQPVPKVTLIYDSIGSYDPRETWQDAFENDQADLLARAMLAEENEKINDYFRREDAIGAGWVMTNRTKSSEFDYALGDDALLQIIVEGGQFALGGSYVNGIKLPGNAAIVASPENYPKWFGGDPRGSYWKAYDLATGILEGKILDPTYGALYFVDHYRVTDGKTVPFADGRTRFNVRYGTGRFYSIPELKQMVEKGEDIWLLLLGAN